MSEAAELARAINAALPQTQCTRCGYPDCAAYADAIAAGHADINQCPPGGAQGVARLAALTGRTAMALNPVNGHEGPRLLAVIDEAWCIGCTLCLAACPVDAIVARADAFHGADGRGQILAGAQGLRIKTRAASTGRAVRGGQLRDPARRHGGKHAFWPRARGVHRCATRPARAAALGRRRPAFPSTRSANSGPTNRRCFCVRWRKNASCRSAQTRRQRATSN